MKKSLSFQNNPGEQTGLPKEQLLMSAIHTHSATSAGGLGEKLMLRKNCRGPDGLIFQIELIY